MMLVMELIPNKEDFYTNGLNVKQWVKLRDGYGHTGNMTPELVELMEYCNPTQRLVMNQIKLMLRSAVPDDPIIN